MQEKIRSIASRFKIYGDFLWSEGLKAGHINDTNIAVYNQGGIQVRYIIQRINHHVFKNPEQLMNNMSRVLDHIREKLKGANDASRRVMNLIPTHDGKTYCQDEDGNYWRCYFYIERAHAFNIMERPGHAFQAAYAFGTFQSQLADMPQPRLFDTIPNFHNTPMRLEAFDKVLKADPRNRAKSVKKEIEFLNSFRDKASRVVDMLAKGELPERITHNDTKLNNVMLDDESGEAVCVIDLDTVMPGSSLYDFGDLIRTTVSAAAEDEIDLARVTCRNEYYEQLAKGFLKGCQGCLTKNEIELMPFSGQLITYETGVRFLTDYIDGDNYFKIARPEHNLDRCRTQFKLVSELASSEEELLKLTK